MLLSAHQAAHLSSMLLLLLLLLLCLFRSMLTSTCMHDPASAVSPADDAILGQLDFTMPIQMCAKLHPPPGQPPTHSALSGVGVFAVTSSLAPITSSLAFTPPTPAETKA